MPLSSLQSRGLIAAVLSATAFKHYACGAQEPFFTSSYGVVGHGNERDARKGYVRVKDPFDEEFEELVYKTLDHWHVPGLSISVVHGEETFAKGYGTAVFPSTNATADTLYYVGSTTKSFTAASILLLIEESANSSNPITLQTPVSSLIRSEFVLPDPYATEHATLEDLLSHRTGMPRHDNSYGGSRQPTPRAVVENLRNLPMTLPLRTGFQYCNMMFTTLAYVVETLASTTLTAFLQDRVWDKLGMSNTFNSLADAQTYANASLSTPYFWNTSSQAYLIPSYLDDPVVAGAGGIISSVADYAKYLRGMLDKHPFLSEASHDELRKPRIVDKPDDYAPWSSPGLYTLAWDVGNYRGLQIYSHNGAVTGYGALMAYAPAANWAAAIMANTDMTSNYATDVVLFHLLDELLDTPKEERFDWVKKHDDAAADARAKKANARAILYPDAPEAGSEDVRQTALSIERYVGTYTNVGYGNITFSLSSKPCAGSAEGAAPAEAAGKYLTALMDDRTWVGAMCLEHVSGEYFVARSYPTPEVPTLLFELEMPAKLVFEIGVGGRVDGFRAGLEPKMGDELLWFGKVA